MMKKRERILTGDRATGKLHLGHYVGSIKNRVKLQQEYETFIIIADIQALTTNFDSPERLPQDVMEVALGNLIAGVDPEVSTIFIQSMIPEIAELTVFYSMIVSVNALRHNPTIKTEARQRGYEDMTYGFLGYPVSQAADITFCKANLVPVGEDQLPHIELAQKIVRRFNSLYNPVLVEPKALLGEHSRLIGLDGNAKMSKSLNNGIFLDESAAEVADKVKSMVTDANRVRLEDKGNPDICTVYEYQKIFNGEECANIREMCKSAGIGCTACKKNLAQSLNCLLEPMRERKAYYEQDLSKVREILYAGTEKARRIAGETLREVKAAMHIRYFE
jgi:tryptophanyl-tRNA synthetase